MLEKLEPIIINALCRYAFYIPAYQRGYRWTKQEAVDLLNDIDDFKERPIPDSDDKTWYCLQPIVVRNKGDNEYEVIDGQQRLTTIYLILHYLNQDFVEDRRDKLFSIDYKTRNTAVFLQNLGTDKEENADNNIDFYYIKDVYSAIKNWFSEKGNDFDINEFRSKFKFNTKVIWYENSDEDAISVFTRLNIGKISLTNAELIKALFLNSSNFDVNQASKDKIRLQEKQSEIAAEWDSFETALHDDRFWFLLSGKRKESNRIELIFDVMINKPGEGDAFYTFREFNKNFSKRNAAAVEDNWKEVKKYYQRFHEWYSERNLYHIIGYLLCSNEVTIRELHDESAKMTKSEFETYLQECIKKSLAGVVLSELNKDNKKVKNVLLLYNILTMLKNSNEDSRFPFDVFKNDKWDIEHISAVADADKKRIDPVQWLKDARPYIDTNRKEAEKLIKSINAYISAGGKDTDAFDDLFKRVIEHFEENADDTEQVDHISNLALLDARTNRGYKNEVFPVKRKTIIEKDKAGEFIPICTKNVFLKYFTDYPPKISFWTRDDREKYEEDLAAVLQDYLEGDQNG